MSAVIRNIILIGLGFYVVKEVLNSLLTGTAASTVLFTTLVPIAIAIGGAIYAITAMMKIGTGKGVE